MDIPLHVALWAVYNGLGISAAFMGKSENPAVAGALAAATGVLSVALVAGGEPGFFLVLEVVRWALMAGLALVAAAVTVGPETRRDVSALMIVSSIRMTLAAVTWLYML